MSIETTEWDGVAVLTCDKCGYFIEFSSFKKAITFKRKQKEKDKGWRTFMENGEYMDACTQCVEAFAKGS